MEDQATISVYASTKASFKKRKISYMKDIGREISDDEYLTHLISLEEV